MSKAYNFFKYLMKHYKLVKDSQGTGYLCIPVHGRYRAVRLDSDDFDAFMRNTYVKKYRDLPNSTALEQCRSQLFAKAMLLPTGSTVYQRAGQHGDAVYLDLGHTGPIYKITANEIITPKKTKVPIEYAQRLGRLPDPNFDNPTIEPLWDILGAFGSGKQKLLLAWLIKAPMRATPCPILVFYGPPNSGKSTSAKYIKSILDPGPDELRCPPMNRDDIRIGAPNTFIMAYNNLTKLSDNFQDDFCLVCDGGTYARRKLYAQRDEGYDAVMRPLILNGIKPFVTKADLLQRCIIFHLKAPKDGQRRSVASISRAFSDAHPQILGWILVTLQKVLAVLPEIEDVTESTRLVDYYRVGLALERVLDWEPGSFAKALAANRKSSATMVLKSSPVAAALKQLMDDGAVNDVKLTYKELLMRLREINPACDFKERGLSEELQRIAPSLRDATGITFTKSKRTREGYKIEFSRTTPKK